MLSNKGLDPYFVTHQDKYGHVSTALSTASYFQHKNLLRRFLRMGMDCTTIIVLNYTVFTWAVRMGQLEIIQIFLEEKDWKDFLPDYNAEILLREVIRDLIRVSSARDEEKNNKIIELINNAYTQSQSIRKGM